MNVYVSKIDKNEKYFIIPLKTVDLFRKLNLRYFLIVDYNDHMRH